MKIVYIKEPGSRISRRNLATIENLKSVGVNVEIINTDKIKYGLDINGIYINEIKGQNND